MFKHLRPTLVLLAAFTAITGLAYPIVLTGIAQVIFPYQANGNLITKDGKVVGSTLIGQNFTSDRYFHGRPSAVDYKADTSGASNAGPTSKALIERIRGEVEKLRQQIPGEVPVDLITTSASGLDPHISPAAVLFQVPRVAKARGTTPERIRQLVEKHIEGRFLWFLGEPRVNVLELNMALDAL